MESLFRLATLLILFVLAFLAIRHGLIAVLARFRFRRRPADPFRMPGVGVWQPGSSGPDGWPGFPGSAGFPAFPAPSRVSGPVRKGFPAALERLVRLVNRRLALVLEAIQWKVRPGAFVGGSTLFGVFGLWLGLILFSTVKGMAALAFLFASAPSIWAFVRLIRRQAQYREEFLPAVEVFYQCYTLAGGRNVRNVLKETLEENRIRYPIRPVFEQLYRNLLTSRDADESLELFVTALGHRWARHFAGILAVALREGNDMTRALEELIDDLRNSRKAALVERSRLLEIRLANFSPIVFLGVFLAVNIRLDPVLSYRYYVLDPAGRNMLLDAFVLIAASFLMGIFLSVRRY